MSAGWDYRYNDWRSSKLVFQASVTENVTGTTLSADKTELQFTNNPYIVKVIGAEAYKPGLPYHTKVSGIPLV